MPVRHDKPRPLVQQSTDREAPRLSRSRQAVIPAAAETTRPGGTASLAGKSVEWEQRLHSATETERLGEIIGHALRGGEVLALFGDLGAGKTTLVRGLAVGLGAAPRSVSSPTFVLIQEYRGRLPLAHADLYRLNSVADLHDLGLSDYLDEHHVVAIEWADKAGADLPADRLEIHLHHRSNTSRSVVLKATGPSSHRLLIHAMREGKARSEARQGKGKERRTQ